MRPRFVGARAGRARLDLDHADAEPRAHPRDDLSCPAASSLISSSNRSDQGVAPVSAEISWAFTRNVASILRTLPSST